MIFSVVLVLIAKPNAYSIIKQVLCALSIAQNKLHFCHYDLHSSNVMLEKCDKDLVMVYLLDQNNSICVPTEGYIPKIIDYGFSYTKDCENNTFYATLAHTDVGFMSCTNDFMSDLKLFLVTVSYDINHFYNCNSILCSWLPGVDNYIFISSKKTFR